LAMSVKHQRSSEPQNERGDLIWPEPNNMLRPLRASEIEALEEALGKPIERTWLVHWVSRGIADLVMLSGLPTAKEYRDELERLARNGRQWIDQIDASFARSLILRNSSLGTLAGTVQKLCEVLKATADQRDAEIQAGRRHAAGLDSFLDKLIGIAKRAKVLPSTPMRAIPTEAPPPPFFTFAVAALDLARDVINTSSLPGPQKTAALMALRVRSKEALIRRLERKRGRIGDYREGLFGLMEWKVD
jgi:hypothetical protein